MVPPDEINVIDRNGGFTIESKPPHYYKGGRFDIDARQEALHKAVRGARPASELAIGDSLWRPGDVLKGDPTGHLVVYYEKSFYQTNDDVTIAMYRVPGYGYPVLVWFDNASGRRIA